MRRSVVLAAVTVLLVAGLAVAAETPGPSLDHHDHHPDPHRPDGNGPPSADPWQQRRRHNRHDKSAPLDVSSTDWWWVAPTVAAVFLVFYLSTNRYRRLGGLSLRLYLTRYFSAEPLHGPTLKGEPAHVLKEQRDAEYGHQFLTVCGCVMLAFDWALNENRDDRYAIYALTALQLGLFVCSTAFDCAMLRAGYVRPIRQINSKLRFAHCMYQVLLFCTDALSTSFDMAMPVDCFVWASIHYTYEAIALATEGLNVIGMSEFAIIVLVNARLMMATTPATGWRVAFALTSLGLSNVSLMAGIVWKATHARSEDRLVSDADDEDHDEGSNAAAHVHTNAAQQQRPRVTGSTDDTSLAVVVRRNDADAPGELSRGLLDHHEHDCDAEAPRRADSVAIVMTEGASLDSNA